MRLNKILIFSIFAVGVAIRLLPAIVGNYYFGFDQALDTLLVKLLVVDHKINLVSRYSGLQGVLMGPLWTWLLAVPFTLTHGNPAGFSIFMSLISLASSATTFFIVKRVSDIKVALLTCAFTLLAPIFFLNSIVPFSPAPIMFLFIFFIWFLYETFVNRKRKYFIPLLFITGVFFQFEIGFAIFCIPTIFVTALFFKSWRSLFSREFIIGTSLFAITFLPQILFDIRHNFMIVHGVINLISGGQNSLYQNHNPLVMRFFDRAWSFGDDFLTMTAIPRYWFIVLPTSIAMVFGWFKSKHKKFIELLLITVVVYYIGFSFYPGPIWTWYRAGLPIVYVLLLTIPLSRVNPLGIVFVGWITYRSVFTLPPENDTAATKAQYQVLDYIYNDARTSDFSYFAYTPPVYDYVWQYQFWQYGNSKYSHLPTNWQTSIPLLGIGTQNVLPTDKKGLTYIIIEPNLLKPYTPYGKLVESRQFLGDIIVEKRIVE